MSEIKYEFKAEHILVANGNKGWNLELNYISWNDRTPKYDLRSWSEDHEKMGKGLTLTKEELVALKNVLNGMELENQV